MSSLPCPDHLKLLAFETLCTMNRATGEVMRIMLLRDEDLAIDAREHLHELEQALAIAYERGRTGATR
jgi:hypothetical protein